MKTAPIVPARIDWDAGGVPHASDFGDVYHPPIGARAQAEHVFLAGNSLPARWAGRDRFVILETGFGLGSNFIATWDAWRADAGRCEQLDYVAIELHPPSRGDLERAHGAHPLPAAWPPSTPGLHPIDFEGGRVRLLLAFGDIRTLLPELRVAADAFFLDGFAPAVNPAMWEQRVLKRLGRCAAAGATAATWSVARPVRDGLAEAGFAVERRAGIGGKREITVARWQPRFESATRPRPARREALVVGAGLAGAWTARALCAEGWQVTVVDRHPAPAAEASGNPAGIFHGTVHGDDGPYARLLRAGALLVRRELQAAIAGGTVAGELHGLLRLDRRGTAAMQAAIDAQRLPPDWVEALGQGEASARAGVPLPAAAWFFPGGGWVDPGTLVRWALRGARFVGGVEVAAIAARDAGWCAVDAAGKAIASAPVLVLADAAGAAGLLAPLGLNLALRSERGELVGWTGAPGPLRLPVAGAGYAVPLRDGVVCDDLERLSQLTGLRPPGNATPTSRCGWRVHSADRLPLAGAVPQPATDGRADQPRLWPRIEGLYVVTALGGRGITLAPLLGRLVAAQIAASPLPMEQSLVDAIDPARWLVKAARRR